MSRILLADDSPHAQRMGERILRDEGHEVITVSDGLIALMRLKDSQPDVIIADISMPEVSGYQLCEYAKKNSTPNWPAAAVFLTAGPVEPVDDAEVARVQADGVLKKPFESSLLLGAISKFVSKAKRAPAAFAAGRGHSVVVIDPDQIRAAVTVALDAAMPAMIDEISGRVVAALTRSGKKTNA
jgi:CheY-like chemotaxis protein